MKKYLLPKNGNFYKANLHCHTTVSDGAWTPEKVKEEYKKRGYSIVAYTDHNALIDHSDLTDKDFVALNGFEIDITDENPQLKPQERKSCHICYIALDKNNITQPCYNRTNYIYTENANELRKIIEHDENKPDFTRDYTHEGINAFIKEGRDCGFFVTYNHPIWSLHDYTDYSGYKGMNAMEIYNHGCGYAGYSDYCPQVYDEMLRLGNRIYCIATDDNHNGKYPPYINYDSFGGFTVIKATKLEYNTITAALVAGEFYASQGPEIYELYYEDGTINIKCSDAEKIILSTGVRRVCYKFGENGGVVNQASFSVDPTDKYIRITVTDKHGKNANTNAYFVDELI